MRNPFWKVYRVEFRESEGNLHNVQFFRGFPWEVITLALKTAEEKSKKENLRWAVWEITRIY